MCVPDPSSIGAQVMFVEHRSNVVSDPQGTLRYMNPTTRAWAMIGVATITLTTVLTAPHSGADPVAVTATVLRIVDGDTVDIVDAVRGRLRVRLLGIDTPETKKPGYTVGCWGPEASAFATDALFGHRVALIPDPTQDRTDRYGRTLAYLDRADGWDYSVEAARAGAARAYVYRGHPAARADEIAAAEQEARTAQRGLWGPPCYGDTSSVPA